MSSRNMAGMLEFRTPGFNPYAVKYSPYYDSRIAVAAAANYGIVGNGRLYALGMNAGGMYLEKAYAPNLPR
jgi:peroxin-7